MRTLLLHLWKTELVLEVSKSATAARATLCTLSTDKAIAKALVTVRSALCMSIFSHQLMRTNLRLQQIDPVLDRVHVFDG